MQTPGGARANADKHFGTLRAQLALRGFSLSRSDRADGPTCFYVERNGFVRRVASIGAAEAILDRLMDHRPSSQLARG